MVWAAERDGSLVVRDSQTGKTIERIISGHDWERILCIEPVGHGPNGTVWCGTEAGPIIVFDRARKLRLEARQHSGTRHTVVTDMHQRGGLTRSSAGRHDRRS